jgi:SWI/SNF-related matrix-associated actin-dependent regulator of chromatin subfamily A-like protein 1
MTELSVVWNDKDRVFEITFPYNEQIVDIMRRMSKRKYYQETRTWTVPLVASVELLEKLIIPYKGLINPEHLEKIKQIVTEYRDKTKLSVAASDREVSNREYVSPEGLEYFPFQKIAIEWMNKTNGNALIADEMGCGKTIEVIGWLNQNTSISPIVIVCPASVKLNWKKEIERWHVNPGKIVIMNKDTRDTDGQFYIINYDILSNFVYLPDKVKNPETGKYVIVDVPKSQRKPNNDIFYQIYPQILILDESHYIKDTKAKRTKATLKLAKMVPYRIALTGTPFLNRPIELYTIANMLDPKSFSNWREYVFRYCAGEENNFGGINKTGHSNEAELNHLLRSTIMLRRRKEDVLKELPPKMRMFIPLECNATPSYEVLENKLISELTYLDLMKNRDGFDEFKSEAQTSVLTSITKARQEIFDLKKEQLIDFISNTVENESHVVVFIYHHTAYDYVVKELKKKKISVTGFIGDDTIKKRQQAIDDFQAGKYQVFVTSTGAGAVGINLTVARTLIFAELDWSLANTLQSEDRIHRIGQTNSVSIYFLIDYDSIEGYMASLLEEKLKTFKSVVDGDDIVEKKNYFGNLIAWAKSRKPKLGE